MRLVDIDNLAQSTFTGKTACLKALEKYWEQNPVKEIKVQELGEYEVVLVRKEE